MTASLDWQLEKKPVIVTGASSGIGAATARLLGSAGASVVLAGRDRDRLDAVARDVEAAGGETHIVVAELTDIAEAEGVVEQAVAAFGELYGIAHLASVFDPRPLAETTPESFEVQWRSNVAAPLFMTKAAVPHLMKGSSVVLVASTIALVGFPGCRAYTATKGAVVSLGRALAVELAPSRHPREHHRPGLRPHADAATAPRRERGLRGLDPLPDAAGPHRRAGRARHQHRLHAVRTLGIRSWSDTCRRWWLGRAIGGSSRPEWQSRPMDSA